MSLFRHPHLTRGVVKTPKGAFLVCRGLVEMPDEIGEALGWRSIEEDDQSRRASVRAAGGNTSAYPLPASAESEAQATRSMNRSSGAPRIRHSGQPPKRGLLPR
jgi:hypothetical protein